MEDYKEVVLPYRTTGEEVSRLLDLLARGRDLSQIATLEYPAGVYQGTVTATVALELLDGDTGTLTARGQQYALTAAPEKPALLLRALLAFPPYGLLLQAALGKGEAETPLAWVVKWWGTQHYGNSDTNRDEGSSALARLLEFTGLGSYVQGRRGHPSRIRWAADAAARIGAPPPPPPRRERVVAAPAPRPAAAPSTGASQPSALPPSAEPTTEPPPRPPRAPATAAAANGGVTRAGANSTLSLHLGSGRTVELSVPPRLTAAEKRRLLGLVELMLDVSESG